MTHTIERSAAVWCALSVLLAAGCVPPGYECTADDQCDERCIQAPGGTCYCASTLPGGQLQWDWSAPAGVAGNAVVGPAVACGASDGNAGTDAPVVDAAAPADAAPPEAQALYSTDMGQLNRLWGTADRLYAVGNGGVVICGPFAGLFHGCAGQATQSENLTAVWGTNASVYVGGGGGVFEHLPAGVEADAGAPVGRNRVLPSVEGLWGQQGPDGLELCAFGGQSFSVGKQGAWGGEQTARRLVGVVSSVAALNARFLLSDHNGRIMDDRSSIWFSDGKDIEGAWATAREAFFVGSDRIVYGGSLDGGASVPVTEIQCAPNKLHAVWVPEGENRPLYVAGTDGLYGLVCKYDRGRRSWTRLQAATLQGVDFVSLWGRPGAGNEVDLFLIGHRGAGPSTIYRVADTIP